jgi:hypothetical protein
MGDLLIIFASLRTWLAKNQIQHKGLRVTFEFEDVKDLAAAEYYVQKDLAATGYVQKEVMDWSSSFGPSRPRGIMGLEFKMTVREPRCRCCGQQVP